MAKHIASFFIETCGNFPFCSKENEDEEVEENKAEHFWRRVLAGAGRWVWPWVSAPFRSGNLGEECHRVGRASHLALPLRFSLRWTSCFIFFLTWGEARTGYFTWRILMSAVARKMFFPCAFLQVKESTALLLPSVAGTPNGPLHVPLEDNNCLLHCAKNNAPKTQSTHWNNDIDHIALHATIERKKDAAYVKGICLQLKE